MLLYVRRDRSVSPSLFYGYERMFDSCVCGVACRAFVVTLCCVHEFFSSVCCYLTAKLLQRNNITPSSCFVVVFVVSFVCAERIFDSCVHGMTYLL